MKVFRYIMIAAAAFAAVTSCDITAEDAFSKDPVAPELNPHGQILMTSGTEDEMVTFSWKPARFAGEGLEYEFYVYYGEESLMLSKTQDLYWSAPKKNFKETIYNGFASLPVNDKFQMSFKVSVKGTLPDFSDRLESNTVILDVYANGDAVPAVPEVVSEEFTLSQDKLDEELEILKWSAARLVYGEDITYTVRAGLKGAEETKVFVQETRELSYKDKVGDLNKKVISLGVTPGEAAEVILYVDAVCASMENPVSSAPVTVSVMTYKPVYPQNLYVAGNHQGWNPATAPLLYGDGEGNYEGFVDLDGEFKFVLGPAWSDGELAGSFDNLVTQGGANLSLEQGLYYMSVDYNKSVCTNHLLITKVGLISSFDASNWTSDVELVRSGNVWEGTVEFVAGNEFKVRMNGDWSLPGAFNMGGDIDNLSYNGDNIKVEQAGTYKVTVSFMEKPWKLTMTKQ